MMRPGAFGAANRREQPHAVNHANECASFRHHAAPVHPLELREQLKHDDLVHLMYDAAHNTASRATRWTEIDSKKVHAMRDAREGHSVTYLQSEQVPAGIHVRRAEGPPRRDRDRPIPKLVERIGRTQDHTRTQLAEISSNIDWPRRFGR